MLIFKKQVFYEAKFLVHHRSCECKCRLNESVCNSKKKWNHNEYPCECKELDNWGTCKNDYKACEVDEYLDIKNCSV